MRKHMQKWLALCWLLPLLAGLFALPVQAEDIAPQPVKEVALKGEDGKFAWNSYCEAGAGSTVYYRIKARLADRRERYWPYVWKLTDKLDAGLRFERDSLKVELAVEGKKRQNLTKHAQVKFKKDGVQIGFTDLNQLVDPSVDGTLWIYYRCELGSEALKVGTDRINFNSCFVSCSGIGNNQRVDGTIRSTTAGAGVLSWQLIVRLQDAETKKPLEGAQLSLQNEKGEYYSASGKPQEGLAVLTTDEEGRLILKGLSSGTYTLEERHAPAGYLRAREPIEIDIQAELPTEENAHRQAEGTTVQFQVKGKQTGNVTADAGSGELNMLVFNLAGEESEDTSDDPGSASARAMLHRTRLILYSAIAACFLILALVFAYILRLWLKKDEPEAEDEEQPEK